MWEVGQAIKRQNKIVELKDYKKKERKKDEKVTFLGVVKLEDNKLK